MDKPKPKGFAAMSAAERRRISALGGKKAQQLGRAYRPTPEEARLWGSRGGHAKARNLQLRRTAVHAATTPKSLARETPVQNVNPTPIADEWFGW